MHLQAPQPKPPKAPTRDLLATFDALHQQHLGVRAVIRPGKDGTLIAALWRSHGELVEPLMRDFFASDDPFILQAGFTVGVFISQAGKLLARRVLKQRQEHEDWHDECQRLHGGTCDKSLRHWDRMQRGA